MQCQLSHELFDSLVFTVNIAAAAVLNCIYSNQQLPYPDFLFLIVLDYQMSNHFYLSFIFPYIVKPLLEWRSFIHTIYPKIYRKTN